MATITLTDVSHRYPSTHTTTVDRVSMTIPAGECMALLGPAKSGKTTLLRMIHGMEKPHSGTIEIGGVNVTHARPAERDAVMAFENYALYPHMTLGENMGFALRLAGFNDVEITTRVAQVADILGLRTELQKQPDEVNGPVRQTIALARAMVRQPKVLLADEPLAKVPECDRIFTREMFIRLQRELGLTTLYATEDPQDALAIGHRVAVIESGTITGVYHPQDFPQQHPAFARRSQQPPEPDDASDHAAG